MATGNGVSGLIAFLRSPLVLSGLLLLSIGIAETILGRAKTREYEAILRETPSTPPQDPAALFPTVTEEQERRDVAEAKLAYYHLLTTAGQLMSGVGMLLFAAGFLRTRPAPRRLTSH